MLDAGGGQCVQPVQDVGNGTGHFEGIVGLAQRVRGCVGCIAGVRETGVMVMVGGGAVAGAGGRVSLDGAEEVDRSGAGCRCESDGNHGDGDRVVWCGVGLMGEFGAHGGRGVPVRQEGFVDLTPPPRILDSEL